MGESANIRGARGGLSTQRLPHAIRDHGGIVVDCKRHGALKSMRARHDDAEPTVQWVCRVVRDFVALKVELREPITRG